MLLLDKKIGSQTRNRLTECTPDDGEGISCLCSFYTSAPFCWYSEQLKYYSLVTELNSREENEATGVGWGGGKEGGGELVTQ